jgi:hypothetical protein
MQIPILVETILASGVMTSDQEILLNTLISQARSESDFIALDTLCSALATHKVKIQEWAENTSPGSKQPPHQG